MNNLTGIILIYCVLSLLLFATLLLLLLWLLRRLLRSQIWQHGWFGLGMMNSLLGLAIALLLRPVVLTATVDLILRLFNQLLFEIPLGIFRGIQIILQECGVGGQIVAQESECSYIAFNIIAQNWRDVGRNLLDTFRPFPYTTLVSFLIIWGIAAFIFGYLRQTDTTNTVTRWQSWARTAYTFLRSQAGRVLVRNVLLFTLIFIGGYLSLASIAAIPILQQGVQPEETFSADTLAQQLQIEHNQLEQSFPEPQSAADPFTSLKNWIKTETALIDSYESKLEAGETVTLTADLLLDDTILQSMRDRRDRVQEKQSQYETSLTQNQSDWEKMRDSAITNLDQAKNDAVLFYRLTEQSRVGVYENNNYYSQLAAWYNRESNSIQIKLEQCQNELDTVYRVFRNWSDELSNTLANTPNPTADLNLRVNLPSRFGFESCGQPVATQTPMPDRQSLQALGPFGLVANWLLQTESFPLALITGMLGFGLLGAAASTVIREEDETDSLVNNLSSVVIRGTLAAIVVFLSVEGGLAIFTQGDADPNPYVLLLTCLVGAVYSEVIWERAKEYLTEQVTNRRNPREGNERPPEEPVTERPETADTEEGDVN